MYNNISTEKLILLRKKLDERCANITPEHLEYTRIQNQHNKLLAMFYLNELRIFARLGNKLAKDTIDYWDTNWQYRIYNDFSYCSVKCTMKETLDAIYNGTYD